MGSVSGYNYCFNLVFEVYSKLIVFRIYLCGGTTAAG